MKDFLNNISQKPLHVVDTSIPFSEYIPISIAASNEELSFDVSSSKEWEAYLENYFSKHKKKVAFGGYLEVRDIYSRSEHFNKLSEENQRNIHLGIDLWCDAGTDILAVLDGEIHSFKNNLNYGDYGPTIIVKHSIEGNEFYSLYGHLSLESLEDLSVGTKVKKGEKIGTLGDSSVNGDYAPHLHFQIMIDIEDYKGDYPGVSSKKSLGFYKENCPNPNLLLKLPNETNINKF
ncbi:peptidoglycan DD-metalloendopeptidase family protein [Tenacibaculum larymnensis]|uniref:Peptidoglycan DD-metalloendopeptidase family protein n=1 Tax=Tenacibaculum larymnensis TaxID=2878201 RepID=A0A9X4EX03_9FLAO|nr:peptidoglycan DD-metalloendopeptidase family protein [Tenacibaculum larymnensis]MDE1207976.1 peptidoglycan DD-metalloendopeptidase family protein [Tenacibaculum larymnensis]